MTRPGDAKAEVMWFRRDLRVADHPALAAAVAGAADLGRPVVPLFVADDRILAGAGANRRAFLAGSLAELDRSLEGSLVLRRGRPEEVVPAFAEEVGATTVFATGDCAPYGRRRDAQVRSPLEAADRGLALVGSPYAVSPGRVVGRSGTPYRVFTAFARAWVAHGWPPPTPATGGRWSTRPSDTTAGEVASGLPGARTGPASPGLPEPGEGAARRALARFVDGPLAAYDALRDRPAVEGTSRLSPYLRFGSLHPRQVLALLPGTPGTPTFRSELAWREFYADVLWHHPRSSWESLNVPGAMLRWDEGPEADGRFRRWAEGTTGFPLVDAGMRQLAAEGWMHNRVRMVAASFLVKDLHLDWRRGARWFLDQLVDGDVASNNHGWQWVAGTGTDAAPFHRIVNPTVQRERFDPDGAYVRRYVPEAGSSAYPDPMVDHGAERLEALSRWTDAKLAAGAAGPGPAAPLRPGRR